MNSFSRRKTIDPTHRVPPRPSMAEASGSTGQPVLFANLTHSPAPVVERRVNFGRRVSDQTLLAKLRRRFGFDAAEAEPNLLDFIKRNRP